MLENSLIHEIVLLFIYFMYSLRVPIKVQNKTFLAAREVDDTREQKALIGPTS